MAALDPAHRAYRRVHHPTIVIGAGPAGLAAAARVAAHRSNVLVLDRAEAVGANWRARYDGLRLNTVRWFSHLPGLRMPARLGRWVGRDHFVEYLEAYAHHHRLRVQFGVTVQRIDRGAGMRRTWRLATDLGTLEASGVVVATGAFDVPRIPRWPGLKYFRGEVRHAAHYRQVAPYVGRSVLVVGAGASGLEIATLLADGGAAHVYLSVRSCQNLFTREVHGIPLTPPPVAQHLPAAVLNAAGVTIHRLLGREWPDPLPRPRAQLGTALRRDGDEPVVADGIVSAVRDGRIELVAAVADLRERNVLLVDGRVLQPAVVIAATGYTHSLEQLVGHLDLLGPSGLPHVPDGGRLAQAPRLAFMGFQPTVTGRLLQIGRQVRRAARTLREDQRT